MKMNYSRINILYKAYDENLPQPPMPSLLTRISC